LLGNKHREISCRITVNSNTRYRKRKIQSKKLIHTK